MVDVDEIFENIVGNIKITLLTFYSAYYDLNILKQISGMFLLMQKLKYIIVSKKI